MKRHIPLLVLTAVVAFSIGQLVDFPVALAATPTTDQLLSQVQALQTKVATIEATLLPSRAAATTTESKLAALQAKVDNMAQALQVTPTGVLLTTPGDFSIDAKGRVSTIAGSTYAVNAGSTVTITGSGTTTLSGSTVKLNNGTKGVSHQNGTSTTVFVP